MDFGIHYSLNQPEIMQPDHINPDCGVFAAVQKIAVVATERIEDAIVDRIVEIARENDVTELIVLDKENIKDALLKASPKKTVNYDMCPTCCGHLHHSHRYCPTCGQKIKKGE